MIRGKVRKIKRSSSHATRARKRSAALPVESKDLTVSKQTDVSSLVTEQSNTQKLTRNVVSGLTEKEIRILELYGNGGAKFASAELKTTDQHIYQRIHRIKKKVEKAQRFLNQINSFRQRFPRVRKSLLIFEKEAWER